MHSVHTSNFPDFLRQLGISLVVSTYQAGKLIILRNDHGVMNTHFRAFSKPMGVAVTREKIAVGTAYQIWELRNVPAVAQKIEPVGKHDACYLPRRIHVTGDIDIHEMAFTSDELWFINTRFSCLCTLDRDHSFVPRWRPPFVTAYDLSDRCHLNGLAIRDDQPRYITTLATSDSAEGWRQNKAHGGILMDITTNEFICQGLSMPHSPRWYQNQLWVLESGEGSIARVELNSGKLETVTQLPGFTRGIDFWGDLAFIGLSKVRETAIFSGIPLTERISDRICGVWVVNLRTGNTEAFLRFEDGVEEIFAVQVIPGFCFPELIDWDEELLGTSFVLPDEALQELAPEIEEKVKQQKLETNKTTASDIDTNKQNINQYFELGNQAYYQKNLQQAEEYYQKCLQLEPNFLVARYNLGVVYVEQEKWHLAQQELNQVIARDTNNPDVFNNLGIIERNQNKLPSAIAYFRKAISLRHNFPDAHFNLAISLLQNGELAEGWREFEWRWQKKDFHPLVCPHPQWQGEDISNKSILIHTEQGAGDAIQFIRYLPLLAEKCQKVILCCPDNLVSLFKTVTGIDRIYTPGEIPLSEFQTYLPLMSLPLRFGTTLNNIPTAIPYIGKDLVNSKFSRLIRVKKRKKVGIVWAGSDTHKNDHNRSCSLTDFYPLFELSNLAFYSLQTGDKAKQLKQLPRKFHIRDLSKELNNFADTAAAIAQLDLIITVDTAVAHLAGALGKPVYTLLCYCPDWRWLLEREDTPWYPTMSLLRQPKPGDWKSVFIQVKRMINVL